MENINTSAKVGDVVIYVDPVARQYNALVTAIYGPTCLNAIYVVRDENMTDGYGRQTAHTASLSHKSVVQAHGNYYMLPGEEPNPVRAPQQT